MPAVLPYNPRSIVLVISNVGLGGAERQLVYLALGLAERGWKVTIASMTPWLAPSFATLLEAAGVEVEILQQTIAAQPGPLLRAVGALYRVVRRERPAALVGFMPHGALLTRLVGRAAGVPRVISSLRNIKSTHRWHDWLLALTRGMDHALVTNSAIAAEAQVRARVTTAGKSVVIPNGFDMTRVPSDRPNGRARSSDFLWLNIAVIRHEKDHAGLLEAVRRLRDQGRCFRLRVAGWGPLLEAMQRRASEMGLDGWVEFLGERTDVFDLIVSADAFVLSSLWEGLPNVLIEAHAGGLPVVSTAVGGCGEIVKDGVSGLLVPPSDPERLAAAMARMMDLAPERRVQMGEAGREHVLSNFSMHQMVESWERLIGD